MNDFMAEMVRVAEQAMQMSRDRNGTVLDYSEASLANVEEILAELAGYADQLTGQQVRELAQDFGCYVLEVARRNLGGQYFWHQARDQPVLVVEEPGFRVALLAWDHVEGRLNGDLACQVPFLYEGFATRVRQAEPGTDTLYV